MPFSRATLTFLRGLARNNSKPWFEANRARYEIAVKEPMAELIEELDVRLRLFAPEIGGDPKRSMFRIHRDIRFSKDKTPYKTHAACWFFHRDASRAVGREAHGGGAGFYFQIAPGASMIGGGLWMPPRPLLNAIRDGIAEHPAAFRKILKAPAMTRRFGGLEEESQLTRMPRGFAEDHPAAAWLKFQSFTVGRELTDEEVLDPKLPVRLARDYAAMTPLVRFLNRAAGLRTGES